MPRHLLLALLASASVVSAASAEVNPFGYSYTAATEEPGETELALWATDRRGKYDSRYDAQDYRLEVERGLTDRLQLAAYLNIASHHVRKAGTESDRIDRGFAVQGASLEFKYRVLDEEKSGIGVALYAEPGWSRIHSVEGEKGVEYELELKAIFSKSWMDRRLLWAGNLTLEPEREQEKESAPEPGQRWNNELKTEASTGLAYRVAPNLYAAIEARYSAVYPDWTDGLHRAASAISAGPTIAWSKDEWSASLTILPQIAGGPGPGNLNLDEWEKREVRLKIAHEF